MTTSFEIVSSMNEAFNNAKGDPANIDFNQIRNQSKNIIHEFIELMKALNLNKDTVDMLTSAADEITLDKFDQDKAIVLNDVRDALCDVRVFSYGAHHMMGIDGDRDTQSVIDGVLSRYIKDEDDKLATILHHASRGVTDVYFEGEYPRMIMRSAREQPDAPAGKFLKSASYSQPVFYDPVAEA